MLLAEAFERRNSGIPQQEGFEKCPIGGFATSTPRAATPRLPNSAEAAIVQALFLERRQHCRIQIIEGPGGQLIDRETFDREHLKRTRW
jgi:hypothetical protein